MAVNEEREPHGAEASWVDDEKDALRGAEALAGEAEALVESWAAGERTVDLPHLVQLSARAGELFPRLPATGEGLRLLSRLHSALSALGPVFCHLQAQHVAERKEGRLPGPPG